MAKSIPVVIEENWETYIYHADGGPVFASFYADADELERDRFPLCARVIFPIADPNENGGPRNDEAEVLWGLEDQLVGVLTQNKTKCVMVGRLTHEGQRELVFQVADWENFRPPVGAWLQEVTDYDIDVSEHEGWEFFDECIWPSDDDWMLIRNQQVIDALIEGGSDPQKEHSIDFAFRGKKKALQQMREKLKARGYIDSEESTEPEQLVMVKSLPLDVDQIAEETLDNLRLCRELDLEFDGWGAAIVE